MKEALKLALEALETCCAGDYSTGHVIDPSFDEDAVNEAITAVKEALAQDEQSSSQEPVVQWDSDGWGDLLVDSLPDGTLLYTISPKRPWVGLTDGDVFAILEKLQTMYHRPPRAIFVQAIEAKLKELNT